MDRTNLVQSKTEFSTDFNAFELGKIYRCLPNGDGHMVMAETFSTEEFEKNFTYFLDTVKEEWETLGLTIDGKRLTKTAFKKRAYEGHHKYGKSLHTFLFYAQAKTLMYGFYPSFNGNKTDALNDAYNNYINILDGHVEALDAQYGCDPLVQRGNSGIPFSFRAIYWKQRNAESNFVL